MKVAIAVFEGVHMLDLTGPAQIFYEGIKMGSDIQVEFISTSLDKMTYISSAGLSFTVTREFQRIELSEGDIIIVPGLDYQLISDELFLNSIRPFIVWLKEQNAKGVRICSVCTGAFILGEAEIIKDKSCTTHWRYCDRLIEKYPGIKIHKKRLFVEDGNIYTTAGMSSGIDLSLYLIEKYFGTERASAIAREVVLYLRRGEGDPQLSIFLQYRNHLEDRIHTIQEWLIHHFNEKNNIESLAEKVFMSPRNLVRLFKRTTGITIGQYIDKLRLEHASKLLSDNYKIEYVSQACGFNSSDQLRHLFKKYKFSLPSEFKSR